MYSKHFLLLSIVLIYFSNASYSQTKKKQIESLVYEIDSLTNVIKLQKTALSQLVKKIQDENDSLTIELNKNEEHITRLTTNNQSLSDYILFQRNTIDSLTIVIDQLISEKNSKVTNASNLISFTTTDYSFEKGMGDYSYNFSQIEEKEKLRIRESNYAFRDQSLNIKLKSGEIIKLFSQSEYDENLQKHFTYLFEDELNGKLYFVIIDYNVPGSGEVSYSLQELDLLTGETVLIVKDIGGDFLFNESKSYLIVKGWYDSEEYVIDNQLKVINIVTKEAELTFKDVEPIDVRWLSSGEFQCVLLKYTKEETWPFSRIPSSRRNGKIEKYQFIHNNWYKQ